MSRTEIKNPLTSLRSAVETLRRTDDTGQTDRLMAIIRQDVDRLDRLITDIADASRLDAELSREAFVEVDLVALVDVLAELVEAPADSSAPKLKIEFGDSRPIMVEGIENRLGQVVRNLLANAMSFAPPGTTLAVRAFTRNEHATLIVEDEGPGIPEEKAGGDFRAFLFRAARRRDVRQSFRARPKHLPSDRRGPWRDDSGGKPL